MMVKVALFATASDIAKCDNLELELNEKARIYDVQEELKERFPELATIMKTSTWSVNCQYVNNDEILHPGAEVGLIPPVSGG